MPRNVNPNGRPKKPQGLKELHGTARADRQNPNAPVFAVAAPPRPSFLDDDPQAAVLYEVAVATLMKMAVVTESDSLALSMLADQLSRYLDMRKTVRDEGMTIEGARGGRIAHPLMTHLNAGYSNIHKMLVQYGLTAATRDNVDAAPLEAPADSFEAFLDKGKQ